MRAWCTALLLIGWLHPAQAADAEDVEAAKRHFQQAIALYNDQNFDAALAEFQAAYRVRHSPAILYNIGLTQKALFRYNDAISSLEQYLTEDPTASVDRKKEANQLIEEMKALLAEVTFDVTPPGAAILLDNRTIGTAPLKPSGIAAGGHRIDVTADGYKPGRKEIIITAGVPMTLRFQLQLIPKTGKVRITANRSKSTVKVDDRTLGTAPVEVELALGGHSLEVSAAGMQTHRSELVIAPGQERTVSITLDPPAVAKARFYDKWYFWTPIVLAIAGGAAAAITVTQLPEGPLIPASAYPQGVSSVSY